MSPDVPTVADPLGSDDRSRAVPAVEHGLARVNVARTALRCSKASSPWTSVPGAGSWRKYRELVAAAQRTRDSPGQPEDVILDEHALAHRYCPIVDVIVKG